jgi:hypothetical protein
VLTIRPEKASDIPVAAIHDRRCAELAGRGCPVARLWVLADNVRARRFYERAG